MRKPFGLIGSAQKSWGKRFDQDYPKIYGKREFSRSAAGSQDADSFSGAGYFGVFRGTQRDEEYVALLKFLSEDDNMLALSQGSGHIGTIPAVMVDGRRQAEDAGR